VKTTFVFNFPNNSIWKVPRFVLEVSYNSFTCNTFKKLFNFLILYIAHHLISQKGWKRLVWRSSLSKPLLSESLLCSDWLDVQACCDWSPVGKKMPIPFSLPYQSQHVLWKFMESGVTVQKTASFLHVANTNQWRP